MRPIRIEMEGFGSFRDATEVDLADVDLFVLAGATGSGKTTIIEAAVFALYGTVPRYDDRRLVAPAINQNRNEARVRLTFGVGDRTFEATRVVRRRDSGATTKEARLEEVTGGGQRTLAGSADELTAAVGDLLGLSFDQFTRSVVLPQGAFDRFLFAKPSERADLLVQLLDLGVYEDIGKRARAVAAATEGRAGELERRLEGELAAATEPARAQAEARLGELDALVRRCDEAQPELDAIRDEGARLRELANQAATDRDALAALAPPSGLDELSQELTSTADALAAAEARLEEATAAVAAAGSALDDLPDPDTLGELRRVDEELARLADERQTAEAGLVTARTAAATAADAERAAAESVDRARESLHSAHRHELAQTLARRLEPGDDCPVCGARIDVLPEHGEATATTRAEQDLAAAERDLEAARAARSEADRKVAVTETTVSAAAEHEGTLTRRRQELLTRHGLPDDADRLADLATRLAAARDADRRAREQEQAARKERSDAAADAERVHRRASAARDELDTARQRVARLEPPKVDPDDLPGAWTTLLDWARERRPVADEAARRAQAEIDDALRRYRELESSLRADCAAAGVEVAADTTPAVAVARARTTAEHRLRELEQALATAAEARAELRAARDEQVVASDLGRHLRADAFERWLLARALRLLVAGASTILRDLSSGGYSLALDDTNQFLVVDHRNADEPRTVRSLSGGERFLASLALALALADHVAQLAAEGAARLESLFLDEGFGTLDASTLDTVAGAIEELGSRGRMVGVITHVRDLAERLPVRFEVRRGPTGSTVERVDQDGRELADTDARDEPVGRATGGEDAA